MHFLSENACKSLHNFLFQNIAFSKFINRFHLKSNWLISVRQIVIGSNIHIEVNEFDSLWIVFETNHDVLASQHQTTKTSS